MTGLDSNRLSLHLKCNFRGISGVFLGESHHICKDVLKKMGLI